MVLQVMVKAQGPIPLDVAFEVQPGELLALVGPSGSGKSTLLRTVAGLWTPAQALVAVAGEAWVDTARGVNLAAHLRHVGMVFQSYALFPHMTAEANVMSAMTARTKAAQRDEAHRLLALVNLHGLGARMPAELSGGQQQRVAVARALARNPQVLLLDEPFSAVDRATREALYAEIRALRGVLDMPVVLVTHDVNEAQLLADRMVVIEAGRMVASGPTAVVMSDRLALQAMGVREAAAMLRATVHSHADDGMTRLTTRAGSLWLPRLDAAPGAQVRVRIMAHEVILSLLHPQGLSAQNILPVQVVGISPAEGPAVMVRLALGEEIILASITSRAVASLALRPGDHVHAVLKSMSVARDHVSLGDAP
ncbi:molybdenum ABC transporter ATP-binding protein [Phaeovulum sp.]|uniref:molybdenum ABC transporter ATP-binding protein n=1 Tax=Phaeovulum sp. TaxID=2934796 RepID=UPI00272F7E2D|nr:molybdenum ABC transporter ATP-binding protein [Phaeovulum sp.]MDP1668371.1 molybdenum ABC transporter ATP-binding protein [Phaeovulum sp.]MDZ4120134.1 molybdenum ABC transporter ATP-binding protein [Phaeovulum sp.]